MDYVEQAQTGLALIEDVKACEHCDTANLRAVVYCPIHRAYLDKLTKEVFCA